MDYKNVREGDIVKGIVYEVKDTELIIAIEGYPTEGTLSLEQLTRKPVVSLKDLYKKDDAIEAQVIKKDDEVILLSRLELERQLTFDALQDFFGQDKAFEALVKGANKGGLSLDYDGYDLFMPASEVSVSYTANLADFAGKNVWVKVIEIRRDKVVVSHRLVEKESEKINKQKELESIKVGDVLEGTVIKILDFGAFVRFQHAEGLVHISQLSHHQVDKVSDVLKEGQKVTVKVIDADGDKRGLSMKALEATPWDAYAKTHKEGSKVTGKIIKKMQFGFLVEVAPDVVGMVNKFDYSWDPNYNLAGDVLEGEDIEVQILSIDPKKRRMQLSKKHLEYNPWDDVKVKIGEKISGEVKVLQSGGALVEIQGVNAFLPIGEIKEERLERVADALKEGDVINAVVKKFDPRRWSLVISKVEYDQQTIREEYQQYMRTEETTTQSQTLGELFAEKFANLKK
jgi:small subunit ribosomal protein S1